MHHAIIMPIRRSRVMGSNFIVGNCEFQLKIPQLFAQFPKMAQNGASKQINMICIIPMSSQCCPQMPPKVSRYPNLKHIQHKLEQLWTAQISPRQSENVRVCLIVLLFGVVHVRPLFSILQGHTLEQSGNKQQQIHSTMLYASVIDPETPKNPL